MMRLLNRIKKPLVVQMEILNPRVRLTHLSAEVCNLQQVVKQLHCLPWD